MSDQPIKLQDIFDLDMRTEAHPFDRPNKFFGEVYVQPLPDQFDYAPPVKQFIHHLHSVGIDADVLFCTTADENEAPGFCFAFERNVPTSLVRDLERILNEASREQGFTPGYDIICDSKNAYAQYRSQYPRPNGP